MANPTLQKSIGQNKDGSYIYEQNMSVAPTPQVPAYNPPSVVPMVKSPAGFNIMPEVNKQTAQKINAPVDDVLGINQKIDSTSPRVQQLRQHFDNLEKKGEYQLDEKQTDYISRFKAKNPSYQNVPDVVLYSKIILADPSRQEELGNVGQKSFGQKLVGLPLDIAKSGSDAINSGIDRFQQTQTTRQPTGNMGYDNLSTGVNAVASTIGALGQAGMGIAGDVLNVVGKPDENTTSYTEGLGVASKEGLKNTGAIIDSLSKEGEGYSSKQVKEIKDLAEKHPVIASYLQDAADLSVFLPFLGEGKTATDSLLNDIREKVLQKSITGKGTTEAFEAGIDKGLSGGLKTGGATLNEYLKQLPEEKKPGTGLGDKLTRKIPEKTISNYLNLTPTERGNVEKILGGKTAEQYILENNLGGKTKGELTDIFQQQATDSYNGIKEKLATITDRIESSGAKTAIDDMLETFDGLSSLEKSVYEKDINYLKQLSEQPDYSLSELHALRQAFDKVNTGMYTAKGAVRSGTRAGAEVEVRNALSNDIQENALKHGVDVRKMNQDLRVALTLKDGLLRSLSQESKNNLVGLQDIGIMGIFSGGEPLTALSLGIGKKFLEGKMPGAAQKLFNLNKSAYEDAAVKRGNTIVTGNGSRLFGLSDSVGSDSASGISKVKPNVIISNNPAEVLAFELEHNKTTIDDAIKQIKDLAPEEIVKHPELVKLQEVQSLIDTTKKTQIKYGKLPQKEIDNIITKIEDGGFTDEQKTYLYDNLPSTVQKQVQEINFARDYPEEIPTEPKLRPKTEKKVKSKEKPVEAPTTNETPPEVVSEPVKEAPTPKISEFTREQATKYMNDNIDRIMKEVKAKKITGEEGKAQMLELQNDMKYLRLGITPEKLKAGKEKLLDGVMDELTKEPKGNLPKTPMKTEKTSETLLNEYDSIKKEIDSLRENAMKKIKNGEDTGDLIPRIKELQTKEESIYNEYKSKRNIEEGLDESNRKIESDKVIEDKKITEMKKSEETDLRGFTDNMSPMEKGKAISLLTNKRVMYKGKAMTLRDAFEKKLEDGWKLSDNGLIFRNPEYLSHTVDVGTPVNKTESAYIKYISKSDTPKTPQVEGKTGSDLFNKNTDIDVNDSIKLVYKGTSDRTLGKMNDYTIYKDGNNVGTTDIVDRGDHYTIGNIELKDYAQRKGIGSDIHKFVIEEFNKPFRTDPSLSDKMVGMLDKLKNEGYLTVKEMPRKNGKGTFTVYESNTKKKSSLPLSQKSEVKYSELDSLVQEAKKYKSAEEFIKNVDVGGIVVDSSKIDKIAKSGVKNFKASDILTERGIKEMKDLGLDDADISFLDSLKPTTFAGAVQHGGTAPPFIGIREPIGIGKSNIEWWLKENKKPGQSIEDFYAQKLDSIILQELTHIRQIQLGRIDASKLPKYDAPIERSYMDYKNQKHEMTADKSENFRYKRILTDIYNSSK